ncbi:MAG: HAD family phosphatase [Chloroflexota bacterium]|nr:HAD family phosphatase [Chloroflexota bacterium]
MKRKIVFDLGNVLIDYNPSRIVKTVFSNPEEQALILKEVFQSEGWRRLDQGLITFEAHYQDLASRFPCYAERIDWLLKNWHKDQPSIPGMYDLIVDVKKAEYQLFLLSNANTRYYTFKMYKDIFKLFSGITFSSELHLLKPQKEIYDRFCQIHNLIPEECLFIDDKIENVQGARNAGWQAHQFVNADELNDFLENNLRMHLPQ